MVVYVARLKIRKEANYDPDHATTHHIASHHRNVMCTRTWYPL